MLPKELTTDRDFFVSVDVETAGPIPGDYSLLQIGACVVDSDKLPFTCFLKPISTNFMPGALKVTGLDLEHLSEVGIEPAIAMKEFATWIESSQFEGTRPVFVGLNAPFDWSFINYYFNRFLGANPFGHSALDLKSMYMGMRGCRWAETGSHEMAKYLGVRHSGDHDALHDAQFQAVLFQEVYKRMRSSKLMR